MSNQPSKELIELFHAAMDGTATEEQRLLLEQQLLEDPETYRSFVEHCQLHAMLAWEHGSLDALKFPIDRSNSKESTVKTPQRSWTGLRTLIFLAASALFVIVSIGLFYRPDAWWKNESTIPSIAQSSGHSHIPWEERDVVGRVTGRSGGTVTILDDDFVLGEEAEVRTGRYRLGDGFVQLTLDNDIEILLESPAEFELVSNMRMTLSRGRMSAVLPEEGRGFLVETPTAQLVDHGTAFAIDASNESASEIHVFQGEVSVRPLKASPGADDVFLRTNQATLIRGDSAIPEGIDIDHDRFIRQLTEPELPEPNFGPQVREFDVAYYFRMPLPADGKTLRNKGSKKVGAKLYTSGMSSPPFKPGVVGSGLYLDGPNSQAYAAVENYEPSPSNQLTVCAWVWAESRPRWAAIAKHWAMEFPKDKQRYEGLGGQFHFGLHDDFGDLELQVRDSQGGVQKLREQSPLPLRSWQFVAFVADGKQVQLYRNGKLVAEAECDGLATDGPGALGIGAKLNPQGTEADPRNPGFWHGRIDELAIFHKALSQRQLMMLCDIARKHKELPAKP
ncbi:FecR protein [Bremerella volcania]|uniref:FecR protein n=1 Tax=Bremerella volcania TaxID=2527984 RepID=A0A518C9E1_9BACT|nr:LamG-like jellyroll fold domain-containing protein [Bremerella volcania]QDU75847.1 FecR protein [Bremerella volcania]